MKDDNVTQKVYDFYQECQFNEADNENIDSIKIDSIDLVAHQLPKITTKHLDSLSKLKNSRSWLRCWVAIDITGKKVSKG